MELTKEYKFEASHVLPKHPGRCSRLHGHSWVLRVSVEGRVNKETGFVMDYADISKVVKPLIESLDHRHLGTWGHILTDVAELEDRHAHDNWMVEGLPFDFYPTSENLLVWIGFELAEDLHWSKLELLETCTSSAVLTREEFERTVPV